jgi:hypothetical protein
MNKKYIITLTEAERLLIFNTVDSAETPKTVRKRCNALLLADTSVGKPLVQDKLRLVVAYLMFVYTKPLKITA